MMEMQSVNSFETNVNELENCDDIIMTSINPTLEILHPTIDMNQNDTSYINVITDDMSISTYNSVTIPTSPVTIGYFSNDRSVIDDRIQLTTSIENFMENTNSPITNDITPTSTASVEFEISQQVNSTSIPSTQNRTMLERISNPRRNPLYNPSSVRPRPPSVPASSNNPVIDSNPSARPPWNSLTRTNDSAEPFAVLPVTNRANRTRDRTSLVRHPIVTPNNTTIASVESVSSIDNAPANNAIILTESSSNQIVIETSSSSSSSSVSSTVAVHRRSAQIVQAHQAPTNSVSVVRNSFPSWFDMSLVYSARSSRTNSYVYTRRAPRPSVRNILEGSTESSASMTNTVPNQVPNSGGVSRMINSVVNPILSERKSNHSSVGKTTSTQSNTAKEMKKSEGNEKYICVICMDKPRNTVLIPCRHLVTCQSCDKSLVRTKYKICPVCRQRVKERYEVFMI